MLWWCATAMAGSVWFTVDAQKGADHLHVNLPATFAEGHGTVPGKKNGSIDLNRLAETLAQQEEGATRQVKLGAVGGAKTTLVLTHQPAGAATEFVLAGSKGGKSFDRSGPIQERFLGDALDEKLVRLFGPGFDLTLDADRAAEVLRASAPALLVDVATDALTVRFETK